MPAPSTEVPAAAPDRGKRKPREAPGKGKSRRREIYYVEGMPTPPFLGDSPSPSLKPKRKKTPGSADDEGGPAQGAPNPASASEKAVDKTDPAKGASPPRVQELPRTASGQASPDPQGCPEVRKELPTEKQDK